MGEEKRGHTLCRDDKDRYLMVVGATVFLALASVDGRD